MRYYSFYKIPKIINYHMLNIKDKADPLKAFIFPYLPYHEDLIKDLVKLTEIINQKLR